MTGVSLRTEPPSDGREPPDIDGFEHAHGEWRLQVEHYRDFLADVTGVDVSESLTPRELKTIQGRLEGCIERYEREGRCRCDDLAGYEAIEDVEDVHDLARFFRVLVANRVEDSEPIPR